MAVTRLLPTCVVYTYRLMRQELQILSGLSHPNIVRVLGGSIKPQTLLLVEELMTGGSLHSWLHKVMVDGK
jgi:serine/threonine protein kinase